MEQKEPDQKYFNAAAVGECMDMSALNEWTEKFPKNGDAWLCRGAGCIYWAWNARGAGRADTVADEGWDLFYERLDLAWKCLYKSAKINSKDPVPWAFMLLVCMGHPDYARYRQACFNKAIERDPENWPAHANMVSALTKKWGGDHEEMLDFAYDAAAKARDGSDVPVILVTAFMKYHFYEVLFEGNEEKAQQFLQRKDVRDAVDSAYRRSLGHSDYKYKKTTSYLFHHFSAWYWLTGEKQKLRSCLEQMDHELFDEHWSGICAVGGADDAKAFAGLD